VAEASSRAGRSVGGLGPTAKASLFCYDSFIVVGSPKKSDFKNAHGGACACRKPSCRLHDGMGCGHGARGADRGWASLAVTSSSCQHAVPSPRDSQPTARPPDEPQGRLPSAAPAGARNQRCRMTKTLGAGRHGKCRQDPATTADARPAGGKPNDRSATAQAKFQMTLRRGFEALLSQLAEHNLARNRPAYGKQTNARAVSFASPVGRCQVVVA
jgi:hypothetical protein